MGRAIGIDLGTTNTAVAVMRDGRPRVLEDEKGYNVFPSCISLMDDGSFLMGRSAKSLIMTRPDRTVHAMKRLMGRRFDSQEALDAQRRVGYRIEASPDGLCQVVLGDKRLTPIEVSARVLSEVRRLAEAALGDTVDQAVITVPAYFNHAQRQATLEAARIAGLRCERLLNEPTAAALAYGFRRDYDRTILIYDLGGGTFDVSVLRLAAGVYETLATRGDTYLGGEDFDFRLVDHLADDFQNRHGVDLRGEIVALQRLKDAAERAKCELSFTDHTTVLIPRVTASRNLELRVDRVILERLVEDLINRTLEVTRKAVADAGLKIADVDDVILVGGQTRMPRIREAITGLFQKEPSRGVHPEEVVAIGAAVHASSLVDDRTDAPVLLDVTPFNLGIDIAGGLFRPIITRNTHVPISATQKFVTARENQDSVRVIIRQGESRVAVENEFLGEFTMDHLTPGMNLRTQVEVTFRLDSNGMLHVSAVEPTSGERKKVTVRNYAQFAAKNETRPALDLEEERRAASPTPAPTPSAPAPDTTAPTASTSAPPEKKRGFFGALFSRTEKPRPVAPSPTSAPESPSLVSAGRLEESTAAALVSAPSILLPPSSIVAAVSELDGDELLDDVTDPHLSAPAKVGMADSSQSLERPTSASPALSTLAELDEDAVQLVGDDGSLAFPDPDALGNLHDDDLFRFEMPSEDLLSGESMGLDEISDGDFDLGDLGDLGDLAEAAVDAAGGDLLDGEDLGISFDLPESGDEEDEAPTRVGPAPAPPSLMPEDMDFDLGDLGDLGLPDEADPDEALTVTEGDQRVLDDLGFDFGDLDDLGAFEVPEEEATLLAPVPAAALPSAPLIVDGLDFDLGELDALLALDEPAPTPPTPVARPDARPPAPADGDGLDFDLGELDSLLAADPVEPALGVSPPDGPGDLADLGDLGVDFDLGDLNDLFREEASPAAAPPPPPEVAPPAAAASHAGTTAGATRKKPARLKLAYRDLGSMVSEYRENLRRGGCVVNTPKPLPVGRACQITVQAPGLAAPLEIAGVVTWSNATPNGKGSEPGMGIEYVLNEQERHALESMLSSL